MPVSSRRKRRGSPPPAAPPAKRGRVSKRTSKGASIDAPQSAAPTGDDEPYIDRLPDELLLLVLEQLQPNCTCRTKPLKNYYNLSLTNRRLGRLANNFLYQAFASDVHDNARFTRTLIANPDLASRVKSMYWSIKPHAYPSVPEEKYVPTDKDKREFRQSVRSLGMPNRGMCLKLYEEGKVHDLFTVCLIHTPGIRELAIEDKSISSMNAAQTILQRELLAPLLKAAQGKVVGNLPTYTQLTSLDIQMPYMRLEEVVQLLRLKSLVKLSLDGVNAPRAVPIPWDMHTSGVREIVILHSCIDSAALAQLMNMCKQLTVIVCQFNPLFGSHTAPERAKVDYSVISKALGYHKEWVKLVDIDDVSDRTIDTYDRGHVASFQDFKKLTVLGIPFEALPKATVAEKDFPIALFHKTLPPTLRLFGPVLYEEEEETNDCEHALKHLVNLLRAEMKKSTSDSTTSAGSSSVTAPPITYNLGGSSNGFSVRSRDFSSPPPPPRPSSSILPSLDSITLRLDRHVRRRHIHVPSFADLPVELKILQHGREVKVSHHHPNPPAPLPADLFGLVDPNNPTIPAQLLFPPPSINSPNSAAATAATAQATLDAPSSPYSDSLADSLDGFAWDADLPPFPTFSEDEDSEDDEDTAADIINAAHVAGIPIGDMTPAMGSMAVLHAVQDQILANGGEGFEALGAAYEMGGGHALGQGGGPGHLPAMGGVGLGWNAGVLGEEEEER